MKYFIFLTILLLSVSAQYGYTENIDFLGVYESSFLEDMFGDQEISEQVRKAHEKAKVTIEITKNQISVKLSDGELFSEEYNVQGKVIIAKSQLAGKDMYYTFYIGDNGILYGMAQRFKKQKYSYKTHAADGMGVRRNP
jgi:hypothetical protein